MRVPYQKHSPTSTEAARRAGRGLYRMECELLILFEQAILAGGDGFTDDELIAQFGTHSVRPRRIYLTAIGKVVDSGTTRKTRSGRQAVVWKLA